MGKLLNRILLFGIIGVIWFLITDVLKAVDTSLFPTVSATFKVLWASLPDLLIGTLSSFLILLPGYVSALALAVALGIIIGSLPPLHDFIAPLVKMLAPVPPTVYIPYAIAVLPSFKTSAAFVIFIGAFWPVFINTLQGVTVVDSRYLDNARILGFGRLKTLRKVVLPATTPFILSGATVSLGISFITLTVAELFGANAGLGHFIQYYSDYADYPRVIAGVLFISVIVSGTMAVLEEIKRRALFWVQ